MSLDKVRGAVVSIAGTQRGQHFVFGLGAQDGVPFLGNTAFESPNQFLTDHTRRPGNIRFESIRYAANRQFLIASLEPVC